MSSVLSQKAVLASLQIGQWTARRLDKEITQKVNDEHHASDDAGRYNKLLIDKEALHPVQRVVGEARSKHVRMTLPWIDLGPRLLPSGLYAEYANHFREFRREFEREADAFADAFPRLVKDRERKLGDMFRPQDYPDPSRVRDLFTFETHILPCPDASDFRVQLGDEHANEIREQVERDMRNALHTAQRDVVERINETVGTLAHRLRDYGSDRKQLRDSVLDKVRELVEMLPKLNLAGDARLDAIARKIDNSLTGWSGDQLREDPALRAELAANADKILADVSDFMA